MRQAQSVYFAPVAIYFLAPLPSLQLPARLRLLALRRLPHKSGIINPRTAIPRRSTETGHSQRTRLSSLFHVMFPLRFPSSTHPRAQPSRALVAASLHRCGWQSIICIFLAATV